MFGTALGTGNPGGSAMRTAVDTARGDWPAGGSWLRTSRGYLKEAGALQAGGRLESTHPGGDEAVRVSSADQCCPHRCDHRGVARHGSNGGMGDHSTQVPLLLLLQLL